MKTGNLAHDAACLSADGACQVAIAAAAGNQATVRAADVTRVRAYIASALATGIPHGQYFPALRSLGQYS